MGFPDGCFLQPLLEVTFFANLFIQDILLFTLRIYTPQKEYIPPFETLKRIIDSKLFF